MSSKEPFDNKVDCRICNGEGNVDVKKCEECDGEGVYSKFKYSCAYDETEKMNEKIYPPSGL